MNIGDDAVPRFVMSDAFLPLDEFIAGEDGLDTGIYLPGLLEPGQWDGQQWFLPKDYSPLGVYYNKAIFDEYGVDYPKPVGPGMTCWPLPRNLPSTPTVTDRPISGASSCPVPGPRALSTGSAQPAVR